MGTSIAAEPSAQPVRLPLQVGTSALASLARYAATLVPGLSLLGAAFAAMAWVGDVTTAGPVSMDVSPSGFGALESVAPIVVP